jgi:hypothetical protein
MFMSVIGGMKKSSTTFLMNARVCIIHMIGVDCYSNIYSYTHVKKLYIDVDFDVYILSLIFYHSNCLCIAIFYPKRVHSRLGYYFWDKGLKEYVANMSAFIMIFYYLINKF